MESYIIFTDGACFGNPGPGGWAAIVWSPQNQVWELAGQHPQPTTNNRMELQAVLEALKSLPTNSEKLTIHTDSKYVLQGVSEWAAKWQKNNWKTTSGSAVANQDIWQELLEQCAGHQITWKHCKGHAGIPGNERVDELAQKNCSGQQVKLFKGSYSEYSYDLKNLKASKGLSKSSGSSSKKAYSYLSLVDQKLERHKTWKECQARVHGRSGAKFKKARSQEEEQEIIASWGLAP